MCLWAGCGIWARVNSRKGDVDAGRQGWELKWDTGHGCERGVDGVGAGLEGSGQQGVGVSGLEPAVGFGM